MFEKIMFIEMMSDDVYYGEIISGTINKGTGVLYSYENVHILNETTHFVPSEDILEVLTNNDGTRREALLVIGEQKEFENEKDAHEFVSRQITKLVQKNILNVFFSIRKEKKKYIAMRTK